MLSVLQPTHKSHFQLNPDNHKSLLCLPNRTWLEEKAQVVALSQLKFIIHFEWLLKAIRSYFTCLPSQITHQSHSSLMNWSLVFYCSLPVGWLASLTKAGPILLWSSVQYKCSFPFTSSSQQILDDASLLYFLPAPTTHTLVCFYVYKHILSLKKKTLNSIPFISLAIVIFCWCFLWQKSSKQVCHSSFCLFLLFF